MNPKFFAMAPIAGTDSQFRANCLATGISGVRPYAFRIGRERGTVLVFAMVMLLILTLLAITAITTSSLQEKMAGNMRDQYMAQEAGDSVLREGEGWVFKQTNTPIVNCAPTSTDRIWDTFTQGCLPDPTQASDSWWSANGFTPAVTNTLVAQDPRYVLELLQSVPLNPQLNTPGARTVKVFYFRVTGWAVGASNYAQGLLQSLFTRNSDSFAN